MMGASDDIGGTVAELLRENQLLRTQYEGALADVELCKRDIEALHDIGIYNYRHPLEDAVAYQNALGSIRDRVKAFISEGRAIEAPPCLSCLLVRSVVRIPGVD